MNENKRKCLLMALYFLTFSEKRLVSCTSEFLEKKNKNLLMFWIEEEQKKIHFCSAPGHDQIFLLSIFYFPS